MKFDLDLFNALFGRSDDIVMLYQVEPREWLRLIDANDSAVKAGVSKEHIGKLMKEFIDPERYPWLKHVAHELIQTLKPYEFERSFETTGGRLVSDILLTPITIDGTCTHILLVARDVTERVRLQEELERMAFHDGLTGVYNRAFFMKHLDLAYAHFQRNRCQGFALAMLDCDKFKQINDTLGHTAGDELLQQLCERIGKVIRSNDILARMGGDEFALLLDGITAEDSVPFFERLMKELRQPFEVDGQTFSTTFSIGITDTSIGEKAHEVLRNADDALYKAKTFGKDTYCLYERDMTVQF